jgi:hypothetical protein
VTVKGEGKMEKGDTHRLGRKKTKKREGWPAEKDEGERSRNDWLRPLQWRPLCSSPHNSHPSKKDGHGNRIKDRGGAYVWEKTEK